MKRPVQKITVIPAFAGMTGFLGGGISLNVDPSLPPLQRNRDPTAFSNDRKMRFQLSQE